MSKPNLLPYYQVKLTLLRCKLSFLENPPKNEDEQYAYDIIQKAYTFIACYRNFAIGEFDVHTGKLLHRKIWRL